MKYSIFFFITFLVFISCDEKEPFFSNMFGTVVDEDLGVGVDGIIVIVRDIDPDDFDHFRIRRDTTESRNDSSGWYQLDNVCYGNEDYITWILVGIDSSDNPNYEYTDMQVTLEGSVDTVPTLYINRK